MVEEELTLETFEALPSVKALQENNAIPFGLSYATTQALGYLPNLQPFFLFSSSDEEQEQFFRALLLSQVAKVTSEFILVDFDDSFEDVLDKHALPDNVTLITDKTDGKAIVSGLVGYLKLAKQKEQGKPMTVIISNLSDFITKTTIQAENFILSLKTGNKSGLNFIIFSPHEYMAKSFDTVPKLMRNLKYSGLIGERIYESALVKGSGQSQEPSLQLHEAYYVMKGGAVYDKVKLPKQGDLND